MNESFFNEEFFAEETPWFGPFLGSYRSVLSNPGYILDMDSDYRICGWVFDECGKMRAERDFGFMRGERSVTLDLAEAFSDLTDVRGCVAILIRPEKGKQKPPMSQSWTQYLFSDTTLVGILNSSNPVNINHSARTGRRGQYRMVSPELVLCDDWRTLSSHSNVSADPSYDRTVEFEIVAYNAAGEPLHSHPCVVPPFGTAWIDLVEMFGESLYAHLKPSGRGSYTVTCRDGAAVGYHFLYNPGTGSLASDHTRPVPYYLNMAYGAPIDYMPLSKRLRAIASVLKFRLTSL